jgi:L-2-hydroxyglutarate oxidase
MTSHKDFEYIIAGAGIVGLATAYQILNKQPDCKVLILEKEGIVAKHQTGNNSGVIHSGIYYKPGSLKAKNCMDGYSMLIEFCKTYNIPFELCGKIIVALNEEEIPRLEVLYERGIANGLTDLKYLDKDEIKAIEPYSAGIKAIYVPQTGIVDYKLVSQKLAKLIVEKGGVIQFEEGVENLISMENSVTIKTNKRAYSALKFINCAGLYADKIAKIQNPNLDIRIIPFRGEYYELIEDKKNKVKNLIYPVPDPAFPFLGVHFTRRVDGTIEAGPNAVFATKKEGYKKTDINLTELWESISWPGFRKVATKYWKTGFGEIYRSFSKNAFTKALQKLMPSIKSNDLIASGAGVRAQACHKNGKLLDDFCIEENGSCVHVLNAPSPAATSSLAIGDKISDLVIFGKAIETDE